MKNSSHPHPHRPTLRVDDLTGIWVVTGAAALATVVGLVARLLLGD